MCEKTLICSSCGKVAPATLEFFRKALTAKTRAMCITCDNEYKKHYRRFVRRGRTEELDVKKHENNWAVKREVTERGTTLVRFGDKYACQGTINRASPWKGYGIQYE
jgi:hypothetical protein